MANRDQFFKIREFINRGRRAQVAVDKILKEQPCKTDCQEKKGSEEC